MDVVEYVSTQAHRLAAQLTVLVITNPTVQTAADLYKTVKDYLGPEATAVMSLARALYGPDTATLLGFSEVEAHAFNQSVMQPVGDQMIDMAADAADRYAVAGGKEQEYLRAQQDLSAQDPQKGEADKQQETTKLEAQWAAQRQADEQDRLSRQQETGSKVADGLEQALRKDQEFLQKAQADQAALEKAAQEQKDTITHPENTEGPSGPSTPDGTKSLTVQDPRLAAQEIDHKERIEKFDKDITDRRGNLEKSHAEDPALPSLLTKFNSAAADARTNKLNELSAERTQLQNQVFGEQTRSQSAAQSPVISDPSRSL